MIQKIQKLAKMIKWEIMKINKMSNKPKDNPNKIDN